MTIYDCLGILLGTVACAMHVYVAIVSAKAEKQYQQSRDEMWRILTTLDFKEAERSEKELRREIDENLGRIHGKMGDLNF